MAALALAQTRNIAHPRRNVRLDTLLRLRWLAVLGQATAVLVVAFGLEFEFPVWACLAVIGLSTWLNIALRLRFHANQRGEPYVTSRRRKSDDVDSEAHRKSWTGSRRLNMHRRTLQRILAKRAPR